MSQPSTTANTTKSAWRGIALEGLERGGLLVLFALVVLYFGLNPKTSQVFLSSANIRNILGDQAVVGLIALAMIPALTAGYFDLSVAANAGVANIAFAAMVGTHHHSIALGIVVALAGSLIVGVINGALIAGLKLNGFVVTLGMYTLIGGLILWYTQGATIAAGIPNSVGDWGAAQTLGVPRPFVLLIAITAVTWYLLNHVPWGRHLESIGSNEFAARLVGVKVDRTVFGSFVLGSLLAGIAGIVLTTRTGSAAPTGAPGYLFPAFAAVFLGATTIRPGRYNVVGTIVGVFFVAVSVTGLTLAGAAVWVQPVFNGGSLIVAVALSTLVARARASSAVRSQRAQSDALPAETGAGTPVAPAAS